MKKVLPLIIAVAMLLTMSVPTYASSSVTAKFAGHMAGTSGNLAYFAIGMDGGGPLYKYNVKTQKKTKLSGAKWGNLTAKGKYIYGEVDKIKGSDGSDRYIYRIRRDGKNKKKLAAGYSPVVKGKYIYYIAVTKHVFDYVGKIDYTIKGIYRMNLNGTGKKKIVDFYFSTRAGKYDALGVISGSRFVFRDFSERQWYIGKKGQMNGTKFNGNVYGNMSIHMSRYNGFESATKVRAGSTTYTASGSKLYARNSSGKKQIASVKGYIEKIIVSGNQICTISGSSDNQHYFVYIMSKNGSNKKKVAQGDNVSGGWGY